MVLDEHTRMEKKNPYVMTIGFDRTDPRHVRVADYLNSLPRKKAQYIVEAVLYYQNNVGMYYVSDNQRNGEETDKCGEKQDALQYETVQKMVMRVLEEQVKSQGAELFSKIQEVSDDKKKKESKEEFTTEDDVERAEIMGVISAFRDMKS